MERTGFYEGLLTELSPEPVWCVTRLQSKRFSRVTLLGPLGDFRKDGKSSHPSVNKKF